MNIKFNMPETKINILMVDSMIGNDYSVILCNHLVDCNVKITLVVPRNKKFSLKPKFDVKRWMPSKDPSDSKFVKMVDYFFYQFKLFFYAATNRKTIIHFQFFRGRLETFLLLILRLFGVKIVKTAHNILPHEKNKTDYFLNNIVYKSASALIVHSSFLKNKLLKNFNVNAHKVSVIPHGNFDFYFKDKNQDGIYARNKINLKSDDNVLLFFGVIREYKGLDLLLDAFDSASEKVQKLKLIIAGNPFSSTLKEKYDRKINTLKYSTNIIAHLKFIPSEKVSDYFHASDLVVLPYKNIDHSGIVHLAFSFGKPILATRVGDFEEVIENGKSGFLLDNNTAEDLSEKIKKVFDDKEKLQEVSKRVSSINKTKYSWARIALKTKRLYLTIAAK